MQLDGRAGHRGAGRGIPLLVLPGLVTAMLLAGGPPAEAQWGTSLLLNDPGEAGTDVKNVSIDAAAAGGFHATYNSFGQVQYKRWNGTLGPKITIYSGVCFNTVVAEARNGDVHVCWENWDTSPAPTVGWSRSTNGGASFSAPTTISILGCSKHPHLAPFGLGSTPDMIMSYARMGSGCDKSVRWMRFNGTSWSADQSIGSTTNSEYDCFGMAWSPVDGAVWRTYDPNNTTMQIRKFTGSWGPATTIYSGSWAVRQRVAVNASGQVMIVWDDVERIKAMLYTPGVGSGPVVDLGGAGYSGAVDVTAIPGTNQFYMVHGAGQNSMIGRRWVNGYWGPAENIANGLPSAFMLDPEVTADVNGRIYCAWEYWGSGKPQQYYNLTDNAPQIVAVPFSLSPTVWVGNNPPADTVWVTNGLTGTLNYTISEPVPWMSLSRSGGSVTRSGLDTTTVTYAVASHPRGTYTSSITVSASGVTGPNPVVIPVTVRVISVSPDLDGDGDVDLSDFGAFQSCLSGQAVPQTAPQCQGARLDADSDVDGDDLLIMRGCFSGTGIPANISCAPGV